MGKFTVLFFKRVMVPLKKNESYILVLLTCCLATDFRGCNRACAGRKDYKGRQKVKRRCWMERGRGEPGMACSDGTVRMLLWGVKVKLRMFPDDERRVRTGFLQQVWNAWQTVSRRMRLLFCGDLGLGESTEEGNILNSVGILLNTSEYLGILVKLICFLSGMRF